MQRSIPNHWYSWNFRLEEDAAVVAEIDVFTTFREKGLIRLGANESYQAYREGLLGGTFLLERDGEVLARARKPSLFRREFVIAHGDEEYRLCARSAFGRRFLVLNGSEEIGSIDPEGMFTRRATVDLANWLPLYLRAFLVWLVMLIWKRESDSEAA